MSRTKRVYLNSRPSLTVENTGGRNLGRCYNASYYKVTSLHPLSQEALNRLREAGFLGYGQEFTCLYVQPDGKKVRPPEKVDWRTKVEATGADDVPCSEVHEDTNEVIRTPSINPYSGKEDVPTKIPYYVYECEDRVDSSD